MTRAEHYRRLAEICLALCLLAEQGIEEVLVARALEFLEMAEEVGRRDDAPAPSSSS